MGKHTLPLDDSNFDRDVIGAPVPFVVEMTGTYCGPCRALAPIIESLAAEANGAYRVGVLNVDDSPDLGRRLGIRGVPTVLVFVNGEERARRTGVTGIDVLRKMVRSATESALEAPPVSLRDARV